MIIYVIAAVAPVLGAVIGVLTDRLLSRRASSPNAKLTISLLPDDEGSPVDQPTPKALLAISLLPDPPQKTRR